ncbi:MAG: PIG-L family deacetylase [Gammaproteobacteria bacterium]|nr:PIG-L family deacetylase [Gammaproteobacteria bacterium]MBU1724858.1 PIG-L family deacetylase [Gammaproteobacteria bacterium]MBU2005042.1 PIG-L family deacetylase [Gammaproteobacteria bacterium]
MFSENKVIFVFAPHPDDEVIACGGTIIKKITMGFDVKIIFMTDGSHSHSAILNIFENPTPHELAGIRRAEALNAANILGVKKENLYFLDAEDTFLFESEKCVAKKISQILSLEKNNIAEIYMPHAKELHRDHSLTNSIVLRVLDSLEINVDVFQYIVWTENTEKELGAVFREKNKVINSNYNNDILVEHDISAFIKKKVLALMEHKTQVSSLFLQQRRVILSKNFIRMMEEADKEVFWLLNRG